MSDDYLHLLHRAIAEAQHRSNAEARKVEPLLKQGDTISATGRANRSTALQDFADWMVAELDKTVQQGDEKMSDDNMKLCIDCAGHRLPGAVNLCVMPGPSKRSPVDGERIPEMCVLARQDEQSCGLEGRFWEAKK